MIKHTLRFLILLIVFTAVLIPFNYFVLEALLSQEFAFPQYLTYTYFAGITLLVQGFLIKSLEERPQKFVINYMAAMGVKIFLSLILLAIHLYFNKDDGKIYAINFTVLYLAYAALGTYAILRLQGKMRKE